MRLAPGTRLGPYEVLAPIGAGGMGEVYRARDTRLDREVAIKVLPSHLSSNPQLRARFEREASTISRLTHPHVCMLHDVGHQNGIDYLVMELLEGETLSQRLEKGPLPMNQVLRYGAEIADALDTAHRQGIVHRDLKPANIILTKSGAKVFDFGLAKYMALDDVSEESTKYKPLTEEGSILGTVQYMAPEQLEGREADNRSDIFALGAILYEMVTGERPFQGKSKASLIASIIEHDPQPISEIQPMSPPVLDHVIHTCLAKDPDVRWQSAYDVRNELSWLAQRAPGAEDRSSRKGQLIPWAISAALLIATVIAIAAAWRKGRTQPVHPPVRLSIVVPMTSRIESFAVSPDGRKIALVAFDAAGSSRLWLRSLASSTAIPLEKTENARYPFWSPDSRFIAFFANGRLNKIDSAGGPPETICSAGAGRGGAWNRSDVIIFASTGADALYRVAAGGGTPSPLTSLDVSRGESTHRWPHFLPDGEHFLYLRSSYGADQRPETYGIYLGSLRSSETRLLIRTNSNVTYASGHLLFVRDTALFAQPFNAETLQIGGQAALIDDRISYLPQVYWAGFAAADGVLVYQKAGDMVGSELLWFDARGKLIETTGIRGYVANPRLSSDKKRIAFDITDVRTGNGDIWMCDASASSRTLKRLTFDAAFDSNPIWTVDDRRIMFSGYEGGKNSLCAVSVAGAEPQRCGIAIGVRAVDRSPNGAHLLVRHLQLQSNSDLSTIAVTGQQKLQPLLRSNAPETDGRWSPDGNLIAYVSGENGRSEVYLTRYPSASGKWQVSTAGGREPVWSPDGKRLFYIAPDKKLMVAEVTLDTIVEVAPPQILFETRIPDPLSSTDVANYDVSHDGRRFLVNTDLTSGKAEPLSVVLNWPAALTR